MSNEDVNYEELAKQLGKLCVKLMDKLRIERLNHEVELTELNYHLLKLELKICPPELQEKCKDKLELAKETLEKSKESVEELNKMWSEKYAN